MELINSRTIFEVIATFDKTPAIEIHHGDKDFPTMDPGWANMPCKKPRA